MQDMTRDEVIRFMTTGSKTGKLATVRADGSPHVAAIWFDHDAEADELVFMTWHTSVKAQNMARDPRVTVLVDLEEQPFGWGRVDGHARLTTDDRVHWATQTSRRYVGDDQAEAFGIRNGVEGEYVVRVSIDRAVGKKDITG